MAKVPYWATRRDLVRQMLQLGVWTDVPRADLTAVASQSRMRIDYIGGIAETSVFDLDPGGTGYMASLSLTVLREPFAIAAFGLAFPWTSAPVIWLSDPAESNGPHNTYQFPGSHSPEFSRDAVINHRADAQRSLRRGKCIEGLLLGYGFDSIPDCFQHGGHVDGTLWVIDQFGEGQSAEIGFWIDRSVKLCPRKRNGPPRKSLFGDRIRRIGSLD
jgi:hypothetical protein